MIEPISSFAISLAAGIAFDLWTKSKQTVDKEIKMAFENALEDWCPNVTIRESRREELKKTFLEIVDQPDSLAERFEQNSELNTFFKFFEKRIAQYQVAFNYIFLIQNATRYKEEIATLTQLLDTTNDIDNKVTEILELVKNGAGVVSNKPEKALPSQKRALRHILFNNYTKDVEEFYLDRNIDTLFINSLNGNNIWLYGFSGIGKTALINRNLIKNSIEYVYCDFSPVEITNSQIVLKEIITCITERYEIELKSFSGNLLKEISDLLSMITTNEVVIVVDELSIRDSSMLKDITEELIKLTNYHNNKANQKYVRFVASTIDKPIFDKMYAGKILEYFEILEIDNWEFDMENLLSLLEEYLQLGLKRNMQDVIIKSSKFSPRLMKKILRKLCTVESIDELIVNNISETVSKEHF